MSKPVSKLFNPFKNLIHGVKKIMSKGNRHVSGFIVQY